MEVKISNQQRSKLLTYQSQKFLIINLIGSYFILTKATNREAFGRNINFQFQDKQYYSTFARHLNLPYARKLSQLIDIMDMHNNSAFQHQWFMFYQIHSFKTEKMNTLQIQVPQYGAQVLIHSKNYKKLTSTISNLFKFHGQTFFFLSNHPSSCQQLCIITDLSSSVIYGLTYLCKDVTICVPFLSICSQKPCPLYIPPQIKPLLDGTCYIRYISNYCTGFRLNEKSIITARHLLPIQNIQSGLEVGIRFYPYNQEKTGYINRVGKGNIDLIQICLKTKNTQNKKQQFNKQIKTKKAYQNILGKKVVALGFGKYGYSPRIFSQVDSVLPTVETGIISKIIKISNTTVFIKTDAALYNGFSGCGIWLGKSVIAMAVFILKNKNNNSNFNRHNFSYHVNFIQQILSQKGNKFLSSQLNDELVKFDKIQTRFKIPSAGKL